MSPCKNCGEERYWKDKEDVSLMGKKGDISFNFNFCNFKCLKEWVNKR